MDDLNQESFNPAMRIGFGVHVERVLSGNVTHFDQLMRLYCDVKLLLQTCMIEHAAFLRSISFMDDLNQDALWMI